MWRTLSVSKQMLEKTLNELEEKGCHIESIIPDGDLNFTVIFKEPKMLNETEE